jgi:hypothetical protein
LNTGKSLNKCILPDLGKLSLFVQKDAQKSPIHPSRKCRRSGCIKTSKTFINWFKMA